MAIAEISKTEARRLSHDLSTLAEANDVFDQNVGALKNADAVGIRAKFVIGVAADVILSNGSDVTGKTLAESFGVVPSTITYGAKLARLARIDAGRVDAEDVDAKEATALVDLERYWNFEHVAGSKHAGSFHTHMSNLVAESGENRPAAIAAMQETFGSTNGAYAVFTAGKNQRFHADDPRSTPEEAPEGDGNDDGNDDDNEISWTVKLAESVDRARRQGASAAEISAEFMRIMAV